jgi:ribosomal protein L21E
MYDGDKVKQKHEASQKSNKFYYNRPSNSSRSLPVLKKGDQVQIKIEKATHGEDWPS